MRNLYVCTWLRGLSEAVNIKLFSETCILTVPHQIFFEMSYLASGIPKFWANVLGRAHIDQRVCSSLWSEKVAHTPCFVRNKCFSLSRNMPIRKKIVFRYPGFGGSWDKLTIFFLNVIFITLQKKSFGKKKAIITRSWILTIHDRIFWKPLLSFNWEKAFFIKYGKKGHFYE